MSYEKLIRFFRFKVKPAFKLHVLPILRIILMSIISVIFVQIPTLFHWVITLGKVNEKTIQRKRLRGQLTDTNDPSSPYRAMEAQDGLFNTPNDRIRTLADLPDYCLENYADTETFGVREVLDIQDEKQPNGKVFKKVRFSKNFLGRFVHWMFLVCYGRLSIHHVSCII